MQVKHLALSQYKSKLRNEPMFYLMLLISVSYWYCLPVMSQSVFSYNEFRGYDILLGILIVALLARYMKQLKTFFSEDAPGRWLYRFSVWATATYPVTLLVAWFNYDYELPFVTLVFLFHLWGFLLAYAGFRLFVKTRAQCLLLLDVFLAIGAIEGLLISLQALGMLPRFWSELYDIYGESAFSATLGPNRQLPGHAMLLVFGVAAAYWRNVETVKIKRLWLASIAAVCSLLGLGLSGSRTAWLAFLVFCSVLFIAHRIRPGLIAFVALLVIISVLLVPSSIKGRFLEVYDYRMTNHLEKHEDETELAKFQSVDSGRYQIWSDTLKALKEKPWLIPFGGGFNTFGHNTQADVSAHNVYLNLIAETGIVGLILYLKWLLGIWRESSTLIKTANRRQSDRVFRPGELRALLVAMMVSLLAGEILSTRRPSFAFLGMFLFLCAVMNHRTLIFGAEQSSLRRLLTLLWLRQKATANDKRALLPARQQLPLGRQLPMGDPYGT
jgi:O-antigen ligase